MPTFITVVHPDVDVPAVVAESALPYLAPGWARADEPAPTPDVAPDEPTPEPEAAPASGDLPDLTPTPEPPADRRRPFTRTETES